MTTLLNDVIQTLPSEVLTQKNAIVLDENFDIKDISVLQRLPHLTVYTNRFDLYSTLKEKQQSVHFNDFEIQDTYENIIYCVSKEKHIANHIINQAYTHLVVTGHFYIAGANNQGIKTYLKNIKTLFSYTPSIDILGGGARLGTFIKKTESLTLLDSKNYPSFQTITCPLNSISCISKPGQYGWNKEDKGSYLLTQTLLSNIKKPDADTRILDLGCGYGYLSVFLAHKGLQNIIATDNNAASISSTKENFKTLGISEENVIADDCAHSITEKFNIIVCNPPFHQGFHRDEALTNKFVTSAAKKLKTKGFAFFVVNEFIPIPKVAEDKFDVITELLHFEGFKVYSLSKPKRRL